MVVKTSLGLATFIRSFGDIARFGRIGASACQTGEGQNRTDAGAIADHWLIGHNSQ